MIVDTHHAAQILWDYMKLDEPARGADVLLVLCSIDTRVAIKAAELSLLHAYSHIVFSGGVAHTDDLLAVSWEGTEAEHFYAVFKAAGGDTSNILLESEAQNTGQNALYCFNLLNEYGIIAAIRTVQLVTKPYMERRAMATFASQWPQPQPSFFVTSPSISFEIYPNEQQPYDKLVNLMVGDMQRIIEYPSRGWQITQEIPEEAMAAYNALIQAGYTAHIK